MAANDFPVSQYYKQHIRDGHTIAKGGGWWSAVLLIEDPKTGTLFIGFYRWQLTEGGWKQRKAFNCRNKHDLKSIIESLEEFRAQL